MSPIFQHFRHMRAQKEGTSNVKEEAKEHSPAFSFHCVE